MARRESFGQRERQTWEALPITLQVNWGWATGIGAQQQWHPPGLLCAFGRKSVPRTWPLRQGYRIGRRTPSSAGI